MSMKCDECRFSIRNNGENMTCNFYRRKFDFPSDTCHDFQYFQPIPVSGMRVEHKFTNKIYTLTHKIKDNRHLWGVVNDEISFIFDFDFDCYEEKNSGKLNKTLKKRGNEMEKYEFKGNFDLELLVNDMFRDMKRSFIVSGKNNAVVCVLRNYCFDLDNIHEDIKYENDAFIVSDDMIYWPYYFVIIDKKEVHEWIKVLKEENKFYNKMILDKKAKIRKLVKSGKNDGDRFKVFSF